MEEVKPTEVEKYEEFWKLNYYIAGSYDLLEDFELLNDELELNEQHNVANRMFYLAVPPTVFECTTRNIHTVCMAKQ